MKNKIKLSLLFALLTVLFFYTPQLLWDIWILTIFILFSFIFLILLFVSFILFYFEGQWRGMWQGSHMTGHMMWCHRPRTWKKNLEDDVRAHGVCIVVLSKKWGKHEVEI